MYNLYLNATVQITTITPKPYCGGLHPPRTTQQTFRHGANDHVLNNHLIRPKALCIYVFISRH